jgi:hypothetical protein
MAHEARCGPSKSLDWVHICVSYNRVRNLPHLYGGYVDYKYRSLNSIEGIKISSHKIYNQQSHTLRRVVTL